MENTESTKNVWTTLSAMNIVVTALYGVLSTEQKLAMAAVLTERIKSLQGLRDLSAENFMDVQETIRDIRAHVALLGE